MKKIFISFSLFSIILLNAQTTILEGKFNKENIPISYRYLPKKNQFILMDGRRPKHAAILTAFINNINGYDDIGTKTKIIENQNLVSCTFSATENSFKAFDGNSLFKIKCQYFLNGISSELYEKSNFIKNGNFSFGTFDTNNILNYYNSPSDYFIRQRLPISFNDNYELSFTNQKGNTDINFENDEFYLETFNIQNKTKNRVKLEKPDLTLLIGDQFVKSKKDLTFSCRINNNDSFDLITKSLTKDYKTSILYKTTYGFNGEKLKTISFNTHLENSFFIYSNNKAGRYDISIASSIPDRNGNTGSTTLDFLDDLSVNNYYEDQKNGDIYIYGLFSDSMPSKKVGVNAPNGYYFFKFDKNGTKIWESIKRIDDKEDFNETTLILLDINLLEFNGNLIFSASYNQDRELTHYAVVDKKSGSVLKYNKIVYNEFKNHFLGDRNFIITNLFNDEFKKMMFSTNGFIALDLSPNYLNYIKNLPTNKTLHFETIFSDKGIWLVETDNDEYYKVTNFKD